MRSSADVAAALESAAEAVVRAAASFDAPVILIDGRSGTGKTTLAGAVAGRLDARLLALDAVYPGWDGLAAGVDAVRAGVLEPRSAGLPGKWRRWDWERERLAEEHTVPAHGALVVEGSGVLTPLTSALADVCVWLDSPLESRRDRALRRDGETYLPHWDRWAVQEEEHLREHQPARLATILVTVP